MKKDKIFLLLSLVTRDKYFIKTPHFVNFLSVIFEGALFSKCFYIVSNCKQYL